MTDKEIKKVFEDSTYIIVDTREKNTHIKDRLEQFGIRYKVSKMDYGDYGIEIEKNPELGIEETVRLSVSVERKMNLDEISTNLTKGKDRFYREMARVKDDKGFMVIMIENATYMDIINHKYKSKLTPKQFLGLLHSIPSKFEIPFIFIDEEESPLFVYNILKYYAREYLKRINKK